jgi:CMP-N-acetylneuraminic acid synthetase/spore coat polysaccharide biosynthesis predicted glycosyltransferase SpsG
MAGKPLIFYSINACLQSRGIGKVVVSTDDEEIALFARRFGAEVLMRPAHLADDAQTLDPVIVHALHHCETEFATSFDTILTVQPTSPLIEASEIELALQMLASGSYDTVLSVVDDRHLCWTVENSVPVPEYTSRVNRQYLPARFRETGAIIVCTRETLTRRQTRIGSSVGLLEVEQEKSFDIDSISDFKLCESLLLRKCIIFNVIGNQSVGMGHVYRTLMIANELVGHNLIFVCNETDHLAIEFILDKNFRAISYSSGNLVSTICQLAPDLVINDALDTDEDFMLGLRSNGISTVNFEDLGPGIKHANLVINALYPPSSSYPNVKSGPEYFCLREEFLHPHTNVDLQSNNEVLLCFGGVDEGNLTLKVLDAIYPEAVSLGMHITVVLGPGYMHHDALNKALSAMKPSVVEIVKSTPAISEYMCRAQFALTSGGRTVLELAALKIPTIVICQNKREETHNFTFNRKGVINLGHRDNVSVKLILETFRTIANDPAMRLAMVEDLSNSDFTRGKKRVMSLIREILEGAHE